MKSKHLLAYAAISLFLSLTGCNTANIQSAVEAAANDFIKNTAPSNHSSYAQRSENINAQTASRTQSDNGKIQIETERNRNGATYVQLKAIKQHDSGGYLSYGSIYLYPITKDGFLSDKRTYTYSGGGLEPLNSGEYYLKGTDQGRKLFATGAINIQRGLTNKITIFVE